MQELDINESPEPALTADDGLYSPTEDGKGELPEATKSALVADIEDKFSVASRAREFDEDRWLRAYHNYRGLYGQDVKFRDSEKSRVFVKITKTKVLAAYGQIMDVLFGSGKFPLGIKPTKVPEGVAEYAQLLPEEISTAVEKKSTAGVGYAGDGNRLKPGATYKEIADGTAFLGDLEETYTNTDGNVALTEGITQSSAPTIKPAEKAAMNMQKVMLDQLEETDAATAMSDSVFEQCLLGTGVIKGPFNSIKYIDRWTSGEDTGVREYIEDTKVVPKVTHVPLWNLFIDPAATNKEEISYVVERHKLNRTQMLALRKRPYFDSEVIMKVLKLGPNYVKQDYELTIENENTNDSGMYNDRYEVLEYWGMVDSEALEESNIIIPQEETGEDEYRINAWICNGEILRVTLTPFKTVGIPYHIFPYENNPYSIYGIGIPENMDDSQTVMNGHARMAIDNLALAGNMVLDIDESALTPGQSMEVYPGKIFKRQAGMPGQAIYGIKFPNTAPENLQMFDKFRQLADESTGLPSYSHGQTGVQSTTRTASGMQMLMGAASLNIKTVVKNIDKYLLSSLGRDLYNWNFQFYDGDLPIRGDIDIIAEGTSSLMLKETKVQKLTQLLQTTANPMIAPFVKVHNIVKEITKSLDLPEEDFINDPEEAKIQAEILGAMQGGGANQPNPTAPQGAPAMPGQQGFSGTPQPQNAPPQMGQPPQG
ncbi:hypothetical protein N9937_02010 [bacterium]|nr:hypothetical protein [bacterium]